MTQMERDYLESMEKGFELKAAYMSKQARYCTSPNVLENLEAYVDQMNAAAELVRLIRTNFERFEKEGKTTNEQATS